MSKQDTIYSLRKRIKELEGKSESLKEERDIYRKICMDIFDSVTSCKIGEYVAPMTILKNFRNKVADIKFWR